MWLYLIFGKGFKHYILSVNMNDKIAKQKKPHLALLMMVKNETKRLHVTLNSILDVVDSIVLYDTGSEDDTLEIAKKFSQENNIPIKIKEGIFENFAVSRNVSIEFAESFDYIDYALLLDCNDELQNPNFIHEKIKQNFNTDDNETAWLLCQEWKSETIDKYWNTRLLKLRCGWRFEGVVHEYLTNKINKDDIPHKIEGTVIFQDRNVDDDKSSKRFKRDKVLLEKEYQNKPDCTRTIFYLAQTYSCLSEYQKAYDLYLKRSTYTNYAEERFNAYLRAAKLAYFNLKKPWNTCIDLYLKSYEVLERAEPLVFIAEHYRIKKQFRLSYTFVRSACDLAYPHDTILFVDKKVYDYTRWHILGIVAYYSQRYFEGMIACQKAIQYGEQTNIELDKSNYKFYKDKKKIPLSELDIELIKIHSQANINNIDDRIPDNITKKEFIKIKTNDLKKKYPNFTNKQISKALTKEWKKFRKNI